MALQVGRTVSGRPAGFSETFDRQAAEQPKDPAAEPSTGWPASAVVTGMTGTASLNAPNDSGIG